MLIDRFQKKQEQVRQAKRRGKMPRKRKTLENYDAEMNEASRNSEEAAKQAAQEQQNAAEGGQGFGDGVPDSGAQNPLPPRSPIRFLF